MSVRIKLPHCERADLVELFAVGALPPEDHAAFAEHLQECGICRRAHEGINPVVSSLVHWPGAELSPAESLWERLCQRIGPEAMVVAPCESLPDLELDVGVWQQPAPGIYCKILSNDTTGDRVSMLVRLDPGVEYPGHTHAGREELHLLDGELWIDERKLVPGEYNRAEAGTIDRRVWSETGCTCVLITSPSDALR